MSMPKAIVAVFYRDLVFPFEVQELTDDSLHGRFLWSAEQRDLLHGVIAHEDEEEPAWYLDEDGYRFDDDALFQHSPWSMLTGTTRIQLVQRQMDWTSGESTFCLTPWFRIGDEYNRRPEP